METKDILEYESTQAALAEVMKKELPLPREPEETEKKFAEAFDNLNVSDLSDNDLMHSMQVFTGFRTYAAWELAKADIERTVAKATYDFTVAHAVGLAPGTSKGIKEKEAYAKMTNVVHDAEKKLLQAEAYYQLLKALTDGYEEKAKVCSRELTRRTTPGVQNPRFYGTQT